MTRWDDSATRNASRVAARDTTIREAERSVSRTERVRATCVIDTYSTGVAVTSEGSAPPAATGGTIDLDPRSALALSAALAGLLTTVWLVQSVPRLFTATAIAVLLALALNPLVEAIERRSGWDRRFAAGAVLGGAVATSALLLLLVVPPTIREVRDLGDDIPRVVDDLGSMPVVGDDLQEADAPERVREWIDELPDRLSVDAKPIENAARVVTDGLAAAFLTLLLAATLLVDGGRLVSGLRGLVPLRLRDDADRIGRLVYGVLGRYIAGSLLVAAMAGTVMLTASLLLRVPLAPLVGMWVAATNPIPQLGGALGGVPFVLLGFTRGVGTGVACLVFFLAYQQLENHVIGPLVVGRAVKLSPPSTMVAALVGVSAGGLVGALFAVPLLGAAKAIYLSWRPPAVEDAPASPDGAPARRGIASRLRLPRRIAGRSSR